MTENSSPPPGNSIARLAALLSAHAPHDGSFELGVPGVHALRSSQPSTELAHGVHRPSLCIVAQGAKVVTLGPEVFEYDASRMLIFSVDLPVAAQVTVASRARPYLCFRLDLDPVRVGELIIKVYPSGLPRVQDKRAVYLAQASEPVVDAAVRLMGLMAQPEEASLLAPLVIDEILIRLLRSAIGARLAQLGQGESKRIVKAVTWLRAHFREPVSIDALAALVHMSPSSLHQHFKATTSMSPLQYQKALRLQEARRLMLATGMEASSASQRVGYASPSQFSREYARMFGNAPSRDISRLNGVASLAALSFSQYA